MVLPGPDLALAWIAARTEKIRLAPAVTVLPLHHPIRVAEQWATLDLMSNGRVDFAAGRGYDRREYEPLGIDFDNNQSIFEEGMEVVRRLWQADGPISHHGRHYHFDNVSITPKPIQSPLPAYIGSFSKPSIELAGRLGCGLIVAPFAAAISFGGLRHVRRSLSGHPRPPRQAARPPDVQLLHPFRRHRSRGSRRPRPPIGYYQECVIPAFPGDPETAPPSYRYLIDMVARLRTVRPEDLGENSVLIGSPARIADTLRRVQAAGIDEVILYFNVGLKPHAQVMEEMARFMTEVAPEFA